jgi:hypothetical protein
VVLAIGSILWALALEAALAIGISHTTRVIGPTGGPLPPAKCPDVLGRRAARAARGGSSLHRTKGAERWLQYSRSHTGAWREEEHPVLAQWRLSCSGAKASPQLINLAHG